MLRPLTLGPVSLTPSNRFHVMDGSKLVKPVGRACTAIFEAAADGLGYTHKYNRYRVSRRSATLTGVEFATSTFGRDAINVFREPAAPR